MWRSHVEERTLRDTNTLKGCLSAQGAPTLIQEFDNTAVDVYH